MKKILLIDKQTLTQKGFTEISSELGLNVIVEPCDNYEHLKKLIDQLKPHLLVIDPFLGGILTFEDLSLVAECPSLQILVTYNTLQRPELTKMLNLGIKNLLCKTAAQEEIIASLQAALLNKKYLCNQSKQMVLGLTRNTDAVSLPSLSPREKEIIHLIADGLPDSAIAQKLFLSFHTIRTHRKNITKKLGFSLKNAAELVWLIGYLNDLI
ncbi:response regulator transcription factor [Mucilaginibacter sp. SMC90]|uniref:LuxR C-terminal-related transcriptional regulator n=1 Tax=Mucilaginibacter sp. SMC90 TaxID=2929803 RepID=UPI001FB3B77E|nr:response regulator transcription factor [Mucilaginibacter sp. SMC90]UOE46250.1 response regulator transcription factor [Mucilaginibacter sp. SMC90]